jgi:hypothetical protein
MGAKAINRYLTIPGSTVYEAKGGVPSALPLCVDADVTLPTIGFPTTTVNNMGSHDVVDQTRVDNLQVTISAATTADNIKLAKGGIAEYIIRFAMQVQRPDNTYFYAGFTAYCMGQVASFGGSPINVGDAGAGTITVNCNAYNLQQDGKELVRIDRAAGALVIDGVDLRAELNKLL